MTSYAHTVNDPTGTISTLKEQVSALKAMVESTFNKPMADILAELEGIDASARAKDAHAVLQGRLVGAKLLVSAAYVFLDVIWSTCSTSYTVYLKAKGVDPKSHPVHLELERVHTYFAKLKKAEGSSENDSSTSTGPTQRIDAAAAGRMISAATGEKRKHTRFDEEEDKTDETPSNTTPPSKSSDKKSKKSKKKQAGSDDAGSDSPSRAKSAETVKTKLDDSSSKTKSKSSSQTKKKKRTAPP
ncbi:hypothetical protein MOBT1_001257c, partial [Malassezia obtusa]